MTAIVVKAFNGLKPMVSQFLLQSGDAVIAENVRLVSGALVPLRDTTNLKATVRSSPQTVFRYGQSGSEAEYWLEFPEDTDVINSPIPNDVYNRIYWTDGGTAKYAPNTLILSAPPYPGGSYTLGIPAPVIAPSASQSTFGAASATITAAQVDSLFVGNVLSVEVDASAAVSVTLTGSGGDVTAATLAADLNRVPGVDASVVDGDVVVKTESQTETSAVKISKRSSETQDYSATAVTYEGYIGPISGSQGGGATYTVSAAQIASLAPGTKLSVKVNNNADVLVTVAAGAGTFPEAVTAQSLKTAMSVVGLNVVINDGTSPTVTITTAQTGTAASFQVRKIIPGTKANFSELTSGSNVQSASSVESRSYVYTYVSAYGEEGPPSAPSAVVTVNPNVQVSVGSLSISPGGSFNIVSKRLYRTSTVGSSAEFQFVAEIPVAVTSYTDTKTQAELGEVLSTTDWVPPPANLRGLKMMANGVAVGFVGNTLYMSEPNLPHAWPHKYPVDNQIVGLAPFRQSVAILTNGHPFLASGVDPGAMTLERLEFPHACLSKQSVVDTGDGCLYAGADGIVSIGAGGMKVVTEQIFSREQWQALNPPSMKAFFHDGRYHVMYQDVSGVRRTLIFDFTGQGAVLTSSDINAGTPITAGYSDARTDTLYVAQGGFLKRFNNAATALMAKWMTGVYRLLQPVNFSFGVVRASQYPTGADAIKLKIYADNRAPFIKTVTGPDAFRLPAGFRAQQWQFELETKVEVSMFAVATSATEIQAIQ